ncbi:MAG: sterol desaturase family protein [Acidimicrobiales bacterium]
MAVHPLKSTRSADLRTRSDALAVLARAGSARVMLLVALGLVAARLAVGGWGAGDAAVLLITLAMTGIVEWFIHRLILHAPVDSIRMTRLGTGVGHRAHHRDPTNLELLLLGSGDAMFFLSLFGCFTAAWSIPVLWLTNSALLGPFLSAYLLAVLAMLHYEWTHLLVHTNYRIKSRYYSRLAKNHRLHHYRNEQYWLGITSNLGDRVMRTLPADKSNVPPVSEASVN